MAIGNALKRSRQSSNRDDEDGNEEEEPLTESQIKSSDFEIDVKYELGELFQKVAGKVWTLLFYLTICIYIYGDLSIYAAAVSKSLRDVTCNTSDNSLNETDPCWPSNGLSRVAVYRLYLGGFTCALGPFFFFNISKTRWLQMSTMIARWVAIILMSSIAIARIIEFPDVPRLFLHKIPSFFDPSPVRPNPPIANFKNLPTAFGVCVYAFMCHHSLPGVITPIDNKRRLYTTIMLPVYVLIYFCYIILSGTGVAAFDYIHDLFTLNFVPSVDVHLRPGLVLLIAEYFLALYPVFALSSNFPIMGTTLSNNLIAIFRSLCSPSDERIGLTIRWGVPFLALLPPILIAMVVNDISQLVSMTGSFGGIFLMYVFPVVLVFYSRRKIETRLKLLTTSEENESEVTVVHTRSQVVNPYRSPFSHFVWLLIIAVWAVSCLVLVILNKLGVFWL
nr:transmembrane protein 104 [Hymenolepis microstoma]